MSISNFQKFINDLPGALYLHIEAVEAILKGFQKGETNSETRDIFISLKDEFIPHLKKIELVYKKFISNMIGHTMQQEIDKQSFELFPDSAPNISKIQFIRIKIIYEWVSSFYKVASNVWDIIIPAFKVFSTFETTKSFYDEIQNKYLKTLLDLNLDIKTMLTRIEKAYNCRIVGAFPRDPDLLVSNLIYEEELNYEFESLFPECKQTSEVKEISKPNFQRKKEDFYHTDLIGTKEWNRNDAYILFVKSSDLEEEEKKFYSSSFVTLNPSENLQINLAAALIRKNSGFGLAPKYNTMVVTLLEFIFKNLFTKDFVDICEDTNTFLYHIGPVVMWNILEEDMQRRDFGYCYYVEKNSIIKFFPENIIKKHIIDFWAEKFFDLQSSQVDSYILYSKGVAGIKESYKNLFDQAAATRKKVTEEDLPLEKYMKENTGKFFGYRRAQVFRRFISDCIWGGLAEVNSTELVNKFFRNKA